MITTPWGEVEVTDAHVHFFSPAFFESLEDPKRVPDAASALGWERPESSEYLADRWVVELNQKKVDSAVLIASVTGDVEGVAAAVDRFPERFRSIVMVNPMAPGADMRCSTALAEGLVQGFFLLPAMHRYSMGDSHVQSLLSIVAGYPGAVVYVHCGMLSLGFRRKLGLPYLFDLRYSNPIDLQSSAMMFHDVPFVIPHFGAGYFREALMLAEMCPNIHFDTSSSNSWMLSDPHGLDLARVFRKALDVVGPRRLLFGSDSSWLPRGWVSGVFHAQVEAMQAAGVSAEDARAILGGNARALFLK